MLKLVRVTICHFHSVTFLRVLIHLWPRLFPRVHAWPHIRVLNAVGFSPINVFIITSHWCTTAHAYFALYKNHVWPSSSSYGAVSNSQVCSFVTTLNTAGYHRPSVCFQSKRVLIARGGRRRRNLSVSDMASRQESREELDEKARQGETVVPGGTGGKSLEAQEHLAEGMHATPFSLSQKCMHAKP